VPASASIQLTDSPESDRQPDAPDAHLEPAGVAERIARSGKDLGLASLQWGVRPSAAPRLVLNERDLRLMSFLYDVNYLTSSQLVALGWGTSSVRAGQHRLKRLHDAGLIDRLRPVRARGAGEWIYRLSARGWKELAAKQMVEESTRFKPAALTSISYAEHDLQLSALILRLALDAAGAGRGLIERMPFEWRGVRSGRIEREQGGQFERSETAKLHPGTFTHYEHSRRGYLEPDATLIAGSDEARFAVLIEYDRTDKPHKQIDRLRRYDWWLLEGWRQTRFATLSAAPVVIFLTSRERPLRSLVKTADKALSAWHGSQHQRALEGTHVARERMLFTSAERIEAADWTMLQTPHLPPALREIPRRFWTNSRSYDLPALLSGDRLAIDAGLGEEAPAWPCAEVTYVRVDDGPPPESPFAVCDPVYVAVPSEHVAEFLRAREASRTPTHEPSPANPKDNLRPSIRRSAYW
jgi:Replication-relaxation